MNFTCRFSLKLDLLLPPLTRSFLLLPPAAELLPIAAAVSGVVGDSSPLVAIELVESADLAADALPAAVFSTVNV